MGPSDRTLALEHGQISPRSCRRDGELSLQLVYRDAPRPAYELGYPLLALLWYICSFFRQFMIVRADFPLKRSNPFLPRSYSNNGCIQTQGLTEVSYEHFLDPWWSRQTLGISVHFCRSLLLLMAISLSTFNHVPYRQRTPLRFAVAGGSPSPARSPDHRPVVGACAGKQATSAPHNLFASVLRSSGELGAARPRGDRGPRAVRRGPGGTRGPRRGPCRGL